MSKKILLFALLFTNIKEQLYAFNHTFTCVGSVAGALYTLYHTQSSETKNTKQKQTHTKSVDYKEFTKNILIGAIAGKTLDYFTTENNVLPPNFTPRPSLTPQPSPTPTPIPTPIQPHSSKMNETSLDDWWKSGGTKGGFVMPYYYEKGEKYYILGNEQTASGWAPFGGKCDSGETPLQCASREFFEESGIRGGRIHHYTALTATQNKHLTDIQKEIETGAYKDKDAPTVFAICTNKSDNNLLIFYFVEWSKDEILNAFNTCDQEMTAFGIVKEADLLALFKEHNKEVKQHKAANTKFDVKSFYKQKEVVTSIHADSRGVLNKGLRDLMQHLRLYMIEPNNPAFKRLKTGEICYDARLE